MVLIGIAFVGLALLTLGGLCLIGVLRAEKWWTKLKCLLCAVVLLSLGALGLGMEVALRAFHAFSTSTPVAEVRCRWVAEKTFDVTWTPVRTKILEEPVAQVFRLKGDQWAVSGGVVKWAPWLTAIGVPSYHKPTRINGRYRSTEEETKAPPTAYDLNGGMDRVWWWLYQLDPYLPFVEAAYGSTAYTFVNPVLVFKVSVTPSGYMITSQRLESGTRTRAPQR